MTLRERYLDVQDSSLYGVLGSGFLLAEACKNSARRPAKASKLVWAGSSKLFAFEKPRYSTGKESLSNHTDCDSAP